MAGLKKKKKKNPNKQTKPVTYAHISPEQMVNPRDIAGNAEEESTTVTENAILVQQLISYLTEAYTTMRTTMCHDTTSKSSGTEGCKPCIGTRA